MPFKLIRTVRFSAVILLLTAATAIADDVPPLVLAENGQTSYRIVIAQDADYGEALAADELARFLTEMTGAEFPIVRDDVPVSNLEIVLGRTNRKKQDEIPTELRTDNWEGFTILREGAKVFIMGNIPRGTLYGVYDWLDVELGVRFLIDEVNHVPDRPTLKLAMQSRSYAPPIERRTIWEGLGGESMRRNRMNGAGFTVLDAKLGGVVWIGPQTHTSNSLVPVEKYFQDHPEYFAEIDGQRRAEYDGLVTQLCMSNPDVARVATDTIRGWLGPEVEANPFNKYVVSVTVNDSTGFCKCRQCVAVNREEGVNEGGTQMRFVNAIARQLAKEYPSVAVETMLYHTQMPQQTLLASNVLMQLVVDPDWRFALDDASQERNREMLARFRETQETIGEGGVYNWIKLSEFGASSYLDPLPNVRHIAHNIRIMNECGVKGLFSQLVQSRGTHLMELSYYLLARAMWRPELDDRETIEEFCRLYYREAAGDVLRYIDFLHDEYGARDLSRVTQADTTVVYDEQFIIRADAILAAAESKARAPEIKQRVATCRLPVWKLKLDRAFGEVGKVFSFPVEWSFKTDPEDRGLKEQWQHEISFANWRSMRIDQHWTAQGEDHRGVAWYATRFEMPETDGARLALWFGAIDGDADIFVDGEKVGEQKLPATSMWQHGFFIPLEAGLAAGEHRIAIRVFKPNYASGIWKPISIVDMSVPIEDELRTAGKRFIEVARATGLTHLSESYAGPNVQTEKMYFPKIEFFLTHGARRRLGASRE